MMVREAPYPTEQVIGATIDIEGLREHRSRANHNCWIDIRSEAFREIYDSPIYPPNQFPSGCPPRTLADKLGPAKQVLDQLYAPRSVHGRRPASRPRRCRRCWKTAFVTHRRRDACANRMTEPSREGRQQAGTNRFRLRRDRP